MTFHDIDRRFRRARKPRNLHLNWQSPYRLLGGAAFSIGRAYAVRPSAGSNPPSEVSSEWWEILSTASRDERSVPSGNAWWRTWYTSFMLTNSIFRIASATEKTLCLSQGVTDSGRDLLVTARRPNSALSLSFPRAHQLLRAIPSRNNERRDEFLLQARNRFLPGRPIAHPLVCVIIQADTDKHIPSPPLKELGFDFALAMEGFMEACELWDDAATSARQSRRD